MTSDKVTKSRQKRLENMKKAAEVEENAGKKSEMLRMISTMEKSINYDYISERFDKLGEQEIKKVKDAYFDTNDSAYIKKKFDSKITKFGFRHDICKHFFNIEEKSIQSIKKIHTEVLLYFKNTKPVSIEELEDCTNLLESLNNIILDAMLIYESMEDKSNVNEDFVKCLNLYIKTFEKRKSSLQYKITLN